MHSASTESLLQSLTEPQRQAVTHGNGPLLVLAGPGSGKTRVITHRAAYLACTHTKAHHILAITFTNKAANEMAQRMAQQVIDTDRSVTLEPMPANERRIIHLALRDHPQVFTESIGEGERRKVSIMPRH